MAKLNTKNRKRRARRERPQKSPVVFFIKTIVCIALIVAIAVISYLQFTEYEYRTEYNSAITVYASGNIDQATKMFEELHAKYKLNPKRLPRIQKKLIECYRHYAADVGISLKEQAKYLSKIRNLDPTAISKKEKVLIEAAKVYKK